MRPMQRCSASRAVPPSCTSSTTRQRWLANRRACDANADRKDGCLESRYQTRAAKLRLFADGPYPFISEQAIVKSGKLKHGTYAIDVSYPQFDSTAADFSAVNRGFADPARQSVDDVLQSEFDAGYEQTFDLYRLNRRRRFRLDP